MIVLCEECLFWIKPAQGVVGICRRRAPKPVTGRSYDELATWPSTADKDGCGDGFSQEEANKTQYVSREIRPPQGS